MKIDTDWRGTPAFIMTYCMLMMAGLGTIFAITGSLSGWPIEQDDAIGFGSILGAVGYGIGFAFFMRRREQFKIYGDYK